MPLPLFARAYRFVRGDGGLTVTVAILGFFVFALYPMAEAGAVSPWWLDTAFGVFLFACAAFLFEPRGLVKALLALLALTVLVRLVEYRVPTRTLAVLDALFVMATSGALGLLFLMRATRDGRINIHRILGACGSFLLLGLVFSQAYVLVALFVPQAFAIDGAPADAAGMAHRFVYYSYITLTSTGYGDITPIHPYARSLATLEAIVGQLYLAVLIARLVGLEMEWREAQRDARREARHHDGDRDR